MNVSYNNERFLSEELEVVLERFYNAEELKRIYLEVLLPSQGLPQPDWKLKKTELIPIFLEVLESEYLFIQLLTQMPENAQQALTLLAWEGDMKLQDIEQSLGFEISHVNELKRNRNSFYGEHEFDIKRKSEFSFIAFDESVGQYWNRRINDDFVMVRLPLAIRQILCRNLPTKPEGYDLKLLDKLPEEERVFNCCTAMMKDLQQIAGFIEQGHIQYTKSENITKTCIRKINKLCENREFFPDEISSNKLPYLRTELLANLLASIPPNLRKYLSDRDIDPDHLRQLISFIKKSNRWVHECLMGHVTPHHYYEDNREVIPNVFTSVFEQLDTTQWVSFENIRQYHRYRGFNFKLYDNRSQYEVKLSGESYYLRNQFSYRAAQIDNRSFVDLVDIPLIQALSFLLAALGLAEISYSLPPKHPRCPTPKEPFLTPFDGILGIRLTQEGAYALNLSNDIDLELPDTPESKVVLNPQCLNAICHHVDPITEMTLLEYMERISQGHYRLTRKSFLKDCQTQHDAKKRLKSFKKMISSDLPILWETFLDNAVRNCVALEVKYQYTLFQLSDDVDLKKLFATDHVLKKYCLKVEGLKIAIQENQIHYVKKRLKEQGYLIN